MATAAIVLAGGSGTRVEQSDNKVYLSLAGRPLLAWSLATLDASPLVDQVVLVVRPADRPRVGAMLAAAPVPTLGAVVDGGPTRHASELAGLDALAGAIEAGLVELVLVHDAARPFLSHRLLGDVVARARSVGGALPALPFSGPVVRGTDGELVQPVPANDLRRAQTPQAFHAREFLAAHRAATAAGFAGHDSAEAAERFSRLTIEVVPGDSDNLKITYGHDLAVAEGIAARWAAGEP